MTRCGKLNSKGNPGVEKSHAQVARLSTAIRNVPLFKTLEMSPFVVVVHFHFPVVVEAVRKVEIRVVCGFPSAVGKSVLWTFPRSGFSTAFRRRASRHGFSGGRQFAPTAYPVV